MGPLQLSEHNYCQIGPVIRFTMQRGREWRDVSAKVCWIEDRIRERASER